jgi:hypothetical protein
MSPSRAGEVDVFSEIIAALRQWADYLEQYISAMGDQNFGSQWSEQDLVELYQVWLQVGNAIRDLARTQPTADAAEVRPEILAIRDGISKIAEIHARQI